MLCLIKYDLNRRHIRRANDPHPCRTITSANNLTQSSSQNNDIDSAIILCHNYPKHHLGRSVHGGVGAVPKRPETVDSRVGLAREAVSNQQVQRPADGTDPPKPEKKPEYVTVAIYGTEQQKKARIKRLNKIVSWWK